MAPKFLELKVRLENQAEAKDTLIHVNKAFQAFLEKDLHPLALLGEIPHFLIEYLHLEKVQIFRFETNHFYPIGEENSRENTHENTWSPLGNIWSKISLLGIKALEENQTKIFDSIYIYPLFLFEKNSEESSLERLPLGIVIIQTSNTLPDYLPFILQFFSLLFSRLSRRKNMQDRHQSLSKEKDSFFNSLKSRSLILKHYFIFERIVGGRDAKMAETLDVLKMIIPTKSSVLIEGESGTGKGLFAQTLHFNGPLAEKPWVHFHCGLLQPHILESQLFGHEKGAFTGAHKSHDGIFVQADGGTVFLDEISSISLPVQAKLLRVIQSGEVTPLGSSKTKRVSLRIISSSQKSLEGLVRKKLFREDLFYRLNVFLVSIPPLRERKEDIPLLVDHFIKEFSKGDQKQEKRFSKEAKRILCEQDWPGNVRELKNFLERICTLTSKKLITHKDLAQEMRGFFKNSNVQSLEKEKSHFMEAYLDFLLQKSGGNVPKAAQMAKIDRRSMYRLMKKYSKTKP
jgi:transcriptional regulator with GAF, ATPase, and Fis domain